MQISVTFFVLKPETKTMIRRDSHYNLQIIEIDRTEYAIALDAEEADEAVKEYVKENAWAFKSEFIIEHSKLPADFAEMLEIYQQKKYEDANKLVLALIENLDQFVQDAISLDGRGHFLALEDGHEKRLTELNLTKSNLEEVLELLDLAEEDSFNVLTYRLD